MNSDSSYMLSLLRLKTRDVSVQSLIINNTITSILFIFSHLFVLYLFISLSLLPLFILPYFFSLHFITSILVFLVELNEIACLMIRKTSIFLYIKWAGRIEPICDSLSGSDFSGPVNLRDMAIWTLQERGSHIYLGARRDVHLTCFPMWWGCSHRFAVSQHNSVQKHWVFLQGHSSARPGERSMCVK